VGIFFYMDFNGVAHEDTIKRTLNHLGE